MNENLKAELEALRLRQDTLRESMESIDRRLAEIAQEVAKEITVPVITGDIPETVLPPATPVVRVEEKGSEPLMVPPPLPVPEPAAPVISPLTVPVPPASTEPVKESHYEPQYEPRAAHQAAENLEMKVGRYWLVRIGIVVLLTGFVLLGNYAYHNFIAPLGAPGKLSVIVLAGVALLGLGKWLESRMASVRNYARVLLAGGAATIYYAAYAAHFVPGLRVIESPYVAGLLLLGLAGGFAWYAERRRSQSVAFTAILLSFYTSAINPSANFTLFSNALLASLAVFFFVRHRWRAVSWLGLTGTYVSYTFWSWHSSSFRSESLLRSGIVLTLGFLLCYWLVFTVAVFLGRERRMKGAERTFFLTVNNGAFFFLGAPGFQFVHPQIAWAFPFFFGLVLLGLAVIARVRDREDRMFEGAYLAQGLFLVTAGIVLYFTGGSRALVLAMESVFLLFCSRFRFRTFFQIVSGLCASAAFAQAIVGYFGDHSTAWAVASASGVMFLFNAWLSKQIRGTLSDRRLEFRSAVFALFGLVLLGSALMDRFSSQDLIAAFALAFVLAMAVGAVLRLPEVMLLSQGYLVAGWVLWIVARVLEAPHVGNSVPLLLGTLAGMHWWQWQRAWLAPRAVAFALQMFNALALVAMGYVWFLSGNQGPEGMITAGVIASLVLAYALLTRAWTLAFCSQIFAVHGAGAAMLAMADSTAAWYLTFGAIVLTAAQALIFRFLARLDPKTRASFSILRFAYLAVVLVMGITWIFDVIPAELQFLVFALASTAIFLPAALRGNREYLVTAGALLLVGMAAFWIRVLGDNAATRAYDMLGLLVVLALQQTGKVLLKESPLFPKVLQNILAVLAILGLWVDSSHWCSEPGRNVAVTIVWALLAFVSLGAGFVLRERAYRLMGLLILAVSVGHVFFIDVWRMGQFAGIMGILALAIVLLALGFVYNRFAEQIRKWL